MPASNAALDAGVEPKTIIDQGLLPGLNVIGEQFECEDIFLPELMQAALAFQAAMAVLEPKIKESGNAGPEEGQDRARHGQGRPALDRQEHPQAALRDLRL